jgi:hypothetical protein
MSQSSDFSATLLIVGSIIAKSPDRMKIEYAQVALIAAHDQGLVTNDEGNSISKQFKLGLKW